MRESWIQEVEIDVESAHAPQLAEPEENWGESSRGWAEGSKTWITVNDKVVRGQSTEANSGPFRNYRLDV